MSAKDFAGFTTATVSFLRDLKANNTRAWFQDHKGIYEKEVKQPAEAFAGAMVPVFHALTGLEHRSKIFRIHRDVRFSKDKTPYNAHLHIAFSPVSEGANPPCWFFGLDTEKLTLGAGIFAFEKTEIDRFRQRVAGPAGTELVNLLNHLKAQGARLDEPTLKRVPSDYPKDHAHAEHLRRKGLAIWLDLGGTEQAIDGKLADRYRRNFSSIKPLFDWLLNSPMTG